MTDHSCVRIILNTSVQPRGPGFWKLNTSLLNDKDYVKMIKNVINNAVIDNPNTEPRLLWDTIKLKCRGASIQYSSKKKREKHNKIKELEKTVNDLQERLISNDGHVTQEQLNQAKTDLDKEVDEITRGNIVRCRVRWHEQGERSSRYFLNLEKRNHNNKAITKLKLTNGKTVSDVKAILEEQEAFYCSKLYTSKDISRALSQDECFFNLESPKLSPDQSRQCEGPLTEAELLAALKDTQNNKAPGPDGFPCEFYRTFWEDLKCHFLKSVDEAFRTGELSLTQKQGAISLIPKKDRDPLLLKNWRPLSLLNSDYKLISKALAARMKRYLAYVVNSDQTGFINGRYIGENIVRIFDIMDYTEEHDIPAVIMSIDYEKAFDFIEWEYIEKVLEFFKFGPEFQRWITILYSNTESCVVNNGWSTKYFKLSRGVRQGCPMSPYLFVLGAELLSLAIRANNRINGVTIDDITHKIIQYADDTAMILKCEEDTLQETFNVLSKFSAISGLKINIEKTKIMRIGALKNTNMKLCPEYKVEWTSHSLSMLGVVIPNNRTLLCELNYEPKLRKIENTVAVWRQRKLTVYGKVTIIKTFLISQIIYLMSVLPAPPGEFIVRLERTLYKFLWNDKTERIRRNTLILPSHEGGIKMPHIVSFNYAIKLSWLKRVLQAENVQAWKSLFIRNLPIKEKWLWNCNIDKKDLSFLTRNVSSQFWKEVIEAWSIFSFKKELSVSEIRDQIIWFNSHIKIQKKPTFDNGCYENNIVYLSDILNDDGTVLTFDQLKSKYNTLEIGWLKYQGIVTAIPREWKRKLLNYVDTDRLQTQQPTTEKLLAMNKVCKNTYSMLVDKLTNELRVYTGKCKWEKDLHIQLELDDYYNLFDTITSVHIRCHIEHFSILYFIEQWLLIVTCTNGNLERLQIVPFVSSIKKPCTIYYGNV